MRRFRIGLSVFALAVGNSRAFAAEEAHPNEAIVLPPFLVEDQRINSLLNGTDWLYSRDGGLEILSACPEDETEQFIRDLRKQRAALGQFIADDFLLHTTLPTTLILFPKSQKKALDEQLAKELAHIPGASGSTGHFRPLPDLRLSEPDSSYIFVVLDDWQWGWDIRHGYPKGQGSALFYSPPYLGFLIESRKPDLPGWYAAGVIRLYQSFAVKNAGTGAIYSAWTAPVAPLGSPWENSQFERDPWISGTSAAALRDHPDAPRLLLPMRELFVPAVAAGRSDLYRGVWEAQAELFVRWALSDRVKDGKARLEKFVELEAAQPVTEDLFQSCFGMGYSDARDALSDFLPTAVSKVQGFDFAVMPFDSKAVDLRSATPAEIHRIKGEWARRTLRVVKANYPESMPLFVAKSRRLLQGPYDRGERDPLLIASLALLKFDVGEPGEARLLLEDNPNSIAARPLACVELAELRMDDALARPAGANGALSEEQAGKVMEAISESLRKQPPIEAAYLLAANLAKRVGRDPTDAERARLNEGARLFPRNSQMVMECASWDLRAHDLASARTLIGLGEPRAVDAPTREKFRLLENLIVTASALGN
jgi:hypothetical protein